jgi:hypothetical protein
MGIFSVLYTIKDAKNADSSTEIAVPDTFSLLQITGFATQMAALINATIKGQITRIGIVLSVTLPAGLRTEPDADSDVEEGARFQFNSVGGFKTGFRLATFDEAFIPSNTRSVDTTATEVAALIAAMNNGLVVSGATVIPCDKRGADVIGLSAAKEQFQSSRKSA